MANKICATLLLYALLLNSVHGFCDLTNICVQKCCDLNYVMVNRNCTYNNSVEFQIKVYEHSELISNNSWSFYYISGMMDCVKKDKSYQLDPIKYPEDAFFLQTDGRLWQPHSKTFIERDQYCLDYFDDLEVLALVCSPEDSDMAAMARKMKTLSMIISMPFLLATFLVYALLPQRNIHGKCLMCYVLSLFGAYLLLVIIQTHNIADTSCITCGIFCLFFFMVSFFWINAMSIDIWWAFSGMKGFSGSKRARERKRFLLYSIYAFGVPLLLVILVSCLNATSNPKVWYNPGIGEEQCWFAHGMPTLLYFYGPLAILIIANVTLFARTALKIRKVQQDTAMLRTDENKTHCNENDKQRFNLYLKLLLAMGINWSMEIISWLVDWQIGAVPEFVWILTDLCNALYGVFIFFIFVFKWNIWHMLKRRYYMMIGKVHLARSMTGTTSATTAISLTEK